VIAPCEYCGQPVADAESFFRHGVGPCCWSCRRIPLALGIVHLVFFGVMVAVAVLMWRALPAS
jgi:hypothetical protein